MAEKRKPGRPEGSKTTSDAVVAVPIVCQMCGSARRSRYTNCRTVKSAGVINGFRYRSVTFRRCKCTKCGKHRIERHLND